jgi:hypothetical protein
VSTPSTTTPASLGLARTAVKLGLALGLALPVLASGQEASAQDAPSPRCRHLHATAESQAYLLVSPVLWIEGVHVPLIGDESGMAYISGGQWQLRAALSWSPIEVARGVMLMEQAGTECRGIAVVERVQRVLQLGDSLGELEARRAERASLEAARPEADQLVARAEERLAAGLGTTRHVSEIRAEAVRLARRTAQLDQEITRLVEAGHEDVDYRSLPGDVATYEAAAVALEDQRSSMRRLSPWIVSVRGGIVPGDRVDWFGQVQVGINLGVFAHNAAEDAVVAARRDELSDEAGELRGVVENLLDRLRAGLPSLRDEMAHLDRLIALQMSQREDLGALMTADVEHTRALIDLVLIGLAAERVHLMTLIETRERALEGSSDETE